MDAILKLKRLSEHRERTARLALANAERERQAQEAVVAQTHQAINQALLCGGDEPSDHLHRHGYALRMEMQRRGAERHLMERQRDVGTRREAVVAAAREKGTWERLAELRELARDAELQRIDQHHLDETGLQGWWRR